MTPIHLSENFHSFNFPFFMLSKPVTISSQGRLTVSMFSFFVLTVVIVFARINRNHVRTLKYYLEKRKKGGKFSPILFR